MTWMRVTMTEAEANEGGYNKIVSGFDAAFRVSGAPEDAALFLNSPMARDYVFYFSPAAARIFSSALQSLGAEACERPSSASLLLGHAHAKHMLE